MRDYALVFLVTAAVTYLLTPLVRRIAVRTRAMHEPRARDTHVAPTPLLGGLAMYGGLVAGLLIASRLSFVQDPFQTGSRSEAGLLLAGGLVVLVGFADDRWGLSAISRLAAQVAAAGILVWSGQALPWLPTPNGGVFSLEPDLSVTLTILLVVVTMNAINFIDGLDGLAAGIVAVAALSFLVYSYSLIKTIGSTSQSLPAVASALVAGMCIGFLPHNFYPARIFMGDIGAMLLGLLLAYGPISSTASLDPALLIAYSHNHPLDRFPTVLPLLVPLAIFIVPYADLMFAVIRRAKAGKPLMAADRQHMHHRLLNIGHSYRQSVLLMYLWAALFSVTVVSLSLVRTPSVVFVAATLVAILALLPATMPRLRPWRTGSPAKPAPRAKPSAPVPPAHAAAPPVPPGHAAAAQAPPAHAEATRMPSAQVPRTHVSATAAPGSDVPRFLPAAPPGANGHRRDTTAPDSDSSGHWPAASPPPGDSSGHWPAASPPPGDSSGHWPGPTPPPAASLPTAGLLPGADPFPGQSYVTGQAPFAEQDPFARQHMPPGPELSSEQPTRPGYGRLADRDPFPGPSPFTGQPWSNGHNAPPWEQPPSPVPAPWSGEHSFPSHDSSADQESFREHGSFPGQDSFPGHSSGPDRDPFASHSSFAGQEQLPGHDPYFGESPFPGQPDPGDETLEHRPHSG